MLFHPPPRPVILIVDADAAELKTLRIGFELEGFEVLEAPTVARMNEVLAGNRCHAALVDLMMPESNGLQLARFLRANHPGVATVLMSAYHLSPVQLSRADTGAVGFVPKPFRFETLVQFIRDKIAASGAEYRAVAGTTPPGGLSIPFDVPETA